MVHDGRMLSTEYFTSLLAVAFLQALDHRLQVVVVFYVAIVLLLIGTNLRASKATTAGATDRRAGGCYTKHVVDYRQDTGYFAPHSMFLPAPMVSKKLANAKLTSMKNASI